MITFINNNLFSFELVDAPKDDKTIHKTYVSSSVAVKNRKTGELKKRVITMISSENEDYDASNLRIGVKSTNNRPAMVSIISSDNNKYDTNVYVIAVPFNGLLDAIPSDPCYKIYKGTIVTSDKRDIQLDQQLYKRVAYMVLTLDDRTFDPEFKNHKEQVEIPIVSYNMENVEDGDSNTVKTTYTITITEDGVDTCSVSENVDPIDKDDFVGIETFPIYSPTKKFEKKKYTNNRDYRSNDNDGATSNSLDRLMNKFNKDSRENQKYLNRKSKRR